MLEHLPPMIWMALAPMALICATSFLKMSVVLTLLRNALGAADVPGPGVVYGFAFALTVVAMMPTATAVMERSGTHGEGPQLPIDVAEARHTAQPWLTFLDTHAHPDVKAQVAAALPQPADPNAPQIVLVAFMVSELKEAFTLGVLLFIPFLMVDLMVAYAISGLGLTGVSPQSLALPVKVLLFVGADGWTLVATGLLKGYT